MDQFSRRIIGFGVQAGDVDGSALCRMFNQAICSRGFPVRLSFDHDPLFAFPRWQGNLRILGIESVRSVPYVAVSHPFVERLIGTYAGSILTGCSSGTEWTWSRSWKSSPATTMLSGCIRGWADVRQKMQPGVQRRRRLAYTITPGRPTATACSNRQLLRE